MSYRDFEEFLASCNAHGVKYLVVGAHAVAFHAHRRATKDLGIYVEPTVENAERLLAAIRSIPFSNSARRRSRSISLLP